ncbi:aldehyde dehydrogenase family protein [Paractinoplanes lichenicola]|uniref:Aldehyde dehydrogenase family protein n=1 Tax=Paractinoplanes lichenicola TaxID=2802976 RepID=A0ABS1VFB2_9ACTN|nr:aldehyde dehydrogenase family protein [Actinoplanes lichenicola]MBL7253310.1 aldehyde dehydrogenase family protein [Actinoplanes lichenicola]
MPLLDSGRMAKTLYRGAAQPATVTGDITEPATGAVLGQIAAASTEDLDGAVARLVDGQRAWARRPAFERSGILREAGRLIEANMPELADWLVREGGATVGKAMFELTISAQALHAAAGLALEPTGETYPSPEGRLSISRRIPAGVVGVIAPFNSPLFLALRSVAPALAVGNSVVVKPDPRTAVSGGAIIAEALFQAGLPEDALAVLPGDGTLGAALVDHPDVPIIAFTGSTTAGRAIAVRAAQRLKRVHLELGGNSALVVFDDVDLDAATSAGAWGSFLHAGQICMSSSRHLVHEAIADEYVARLAARASALPVGNAALDPSVAIGPIIDARQRDAVHTIVTDTADAGATVVTGGTYDGLFYSPTVLSGVRPGMSAYDLEIFGPVAPVTTFASFDEAVELANGTEYGLSAGVLTADVGRGLAFADRIVSGNVHVNDQTLVDDVLQPFGGVRASGNGSRVGSSRYNADAFTEQQWLTSRPTIARYPF